MVTVTVFFEGGGRSHDNKNVETVENTSRLRESFNKLLNQGLANENVKIQAQPAYSITNVVKIRQKNSLLLMDLDGSKTIKQQRIMDNKLIDIQDTLFFMVQEMEAWILSQPEVIETVFSHYKTKGGLISEDEAIKGKEIENITKPSNVLYILLQRHFTYTKGEKVKKLKYGKLTHSPSLIERLNIQKLCETFEDVRLLMQKINSY